jgi:molecular chaperone Hsp33
VPDSVLTLEAPSAGLRLAVCMARDVALDASARHRLAPGSAGALAQGLTAALLLAAHDGARVDVQLECNGPLRGLLVDGDESGVVRGLVRVNTVQGAPRAPERARFDARPVLASAHDERAGMLSVLRAPGAGEGAHRAAFPFAGADLGAALTLYLRGGHAQGGEMAVEALVSADESIAAAAGVVVWPLGESDGERARALGKPLRQGGLAAALLRAQDARGLAAALFSAFALGRLRAVAELQPRFACRCSRERVERALRSLGAPELRDMAAKDGGASLTCDFCNAAYAFSADDLVRIAQG